MPQNNVYEDKSQLRASCQLTMDRIVHARQRAYANNKPCHTTQAVSEKAAILSKRLADPTDITARDDALVFLSFRYASLSRQSILKLKTELQHYDNRERMLEKDLPGLVTESFCEGAQPVKKNIVSLAGRFNEVADIKPGEEPLWYKIYIHSAQGNYAQMR